MDSDSKVFAGLVAATIQLIQQSIQHSSHFNVLSPRKSLSNLCRFISMLWIENVNKLLLAHLFPEDFQHKANPLTQIENYNLFHGTR